ncbi:MAG TPA: serine hydrolase [Pyrinomonadaceae bacterium]|jgi:CubicO group peptidase (beta-lactamase class C family)|nr:serine hydrolase [Pyrinomonadaceae bacterium]
MTKNFAIVAIVLSFLSALLAQGQIKRLDGSTIATAEIDATVTRLMRAAEVTGVSIAIFNDGRLDYLKTYGFRDKEKNLPLTGNSVMTGASFTKVAFAYMVMQLVQEKVLDLDKPVYEYLSKPLPEYPQYQDLAGDSRYKAITARMLLDHTSGFANLRFLEPDRKLKIHFDPGTRYAYSGEGMMLLQLVVETITKQPLNDLMNVRVFKPLGMSRTSMVWEDRFENDFANGYDEYGRSLGPDRQKQANAAGSTLTTPHDFALFMLAIMHGTALTKQTRELMLSPQIQIFSKRQFPTLANETTDENKSMRLSYGLGWGLYWTPYGKAFFKEGHSDGWRNYTVCFDEKKSGIVIMTNNSNGEGIFKELLETLERNTFTPIEWEGYTPYTQLPPRQPLMQRNEITLEAKLLDRYVGRYGNPPDLIMKITRENNHLFIQENDEARQELAAESETTFFSKSSTDSLTFESDEHGRVVRMVMHLGAKDLPLKRID